MKKILLLSILGLILIVSSCCQKRVYCSSGYLDFAFTGFERSEVRSFTLRRYVKDSIYGRVLDSAQYVYYGNAPVSLTKPDTLPLSDYRTVSKYDKGITTGNDWAIYLPATGKEFTITNLFDDNNNYIMSKCGDDGASCGKMIVNYSINNQWQSGSYLYLDKKLYQ